MARNKANYRTRGTQRGPGYATWHIARNMAQGTQHVARHAAWHRARNMAQGTQHGTGHATCHRARNMPQGTQHSVEHATLKHILTYSMAVVIKFNYTICDLATLHHSSTSLSPSQHTTLAPLQLFQLHSHPSSSTLTPTSPLAPLQLHSHPYISTLTPTAPLSPLQLHSHSALMPLTTYHFSPFIHVAETRNSVRCNHHEIGLTSHII